MAIKYKLVNSSSTNSLTSITQLSDDDKFLMSIPVDEGNIDYQEYLAWVEDGNTAEAADPIDNWIPIRRERERLLENSDWTQFNDSPLTDSKKTEWATYRQKLRDLPEDQKSKTKSEDITWPTKPS